MNKLELIINFDELTATTTKCVGTDNNGLYTILYNGAFSNNVSAIHIINHFFVSAKILKAVRVCLVRNISCTINGKDISCWEDLRPYQQDIYEYVERISETADATKAFNLIVQNRELINHYKEGIDNLHTFLDSYIHNSGYDVSLSSAISCDTLSSGRYVDSTGEHEWSRNYTKKETQYRVSLLDKLMMYINIKWYQENGFEPERNDSDIVVPVSACDLSTQMYFYGD